MSTLSPLFPYSPIRFGTNIAYSVSSVASVTVDPPGRRERNVSNGTVRSCSMARNKSSSPVLSTILLHCGKGDTILFPAFGHKFFFEFHRVGKEES